MSISEAQNRAVGEFVDLVAEKVGSGGRAIHPETAISSAGRVAGSLLLRSFNFDLASHEPDTVLLSNEANEKGPMLFGAMAGFLAHSGVPLNKELLGGDQASRGTPPQLSFQDALTLLQSDAMSIAKRNGLTLEEAAQAAAVATGFIVKECAKNIGVETGSNIAMYSFIEGSKTVPPSLGDVGPTKSPKKPWYKVW